MCWKNSGFEPAQVPHVNRTAANHVEETDCFLFITSFTRVLLHDGQFVAALTQVIIRRRRLDGGSLVTMLTYMTCKWSKEKRNIPVFKDTQHTWNESLSRLHCFTGACNQFITQPRTSCASGKKKAANVWRCLSSFWHLRFNETCMVRLCLVKPEQLIQV